MWMDVAMMGGVTCEVISLHRNTNCLKADSSLVEKSWTVKKDLAQFGRLEDLHNGTWLTESTIQTTTMLFSIEIGQELSKTHCVFDIVKQGTNKRQSDELMRA